MRAPTQTFRDTILMPGFKQGVPDGFQTPPQETTFDACKVMHQ